jgi:hypothetical protein
MVYWKVLKESRLYGAALETVYIKQATGKGAANQPYPYAVLLTYKVYNPKRNKTETKRSICKRVIELSEAVRFYNEIIESRQPTLTLLVIKDKIGLPVRCRIKNQVGSFLITAIEELPFIYWATILDNDGVTRRELYRPDSEMVVKLPIERS